MKVILTKEVANLGARGDIKDVSPNYARNVLLKNNLASLATPQNLKKLQEQKAKIEKENAAKQAAVKKTGEQLSKISLTITENANEQGTLFASVDGKKIANALKKAHGLSITSAAIKLKEPIKERGKFTISFKLSNECTGSFELIIK